jgi:hypothetical protein
METIANTHYYRIEVDSSKNRLYFHVVGDWKSLADVPHYIEDMTAAVSRLKKPFTMFADLSKMAIPGPEIAKLHMEAQKITLEAGLSKVAELVKHGTLDVHLKSYSEESHLFRRPFESGEEAEAWLNT